MFYQYAYYFYVRLNKSRQMLKPEMNIVPSVRKILRSPDAWSIFDFSFSEMFRQD